MPGYVEGKDKNEILTALVDTAEPGLKTRDTEGAIAHLAQDGRSPREGYQTIPATRPRHEP